MNLKTIGKHLRKLRLNRGLKLSWVATQMSINESQLCEMELGKRGWTADRVQQYRKVIDA